MSKGTNLLSAYNTPIIALTIVDEIIKKIVSCRNRSEVLRYIDKLGKTTGRFHIADETELENANEDELNPWW